MDFRQVPLFSTLQRQMSYLGARQTVLAQNIANADTPGYVPKDLEKPDFARSIAMAAGSLSRTNPMHFSGARQGGSAFKTIARHETAETNPNGNKVSIEEEIQKMSINQADYMQATALYRKTVAMFKTAIGKQGGA